MIYSILIYGSEERVEAWTRDEEDEVLGRHAALRESLLAQGRLGPVLRLEANAATVVRRADELPLVTDGPFAETKEQLMGLYVIDCATLDDAVQAARQLAFDTGVFEIRPVTWLDPGVVPARTPPEGR
jgi:hypothetical protein